MGKLRSGLIRYNDLSHRGPQVTDFGLLALRGMGWISTFVDGKGPW